MNNIILRPFYKGLQLQAAQTIFADSHVHHIGKLNFDNKIGSMDLGLINTFKIFSLPVTILNQDFGVSELYEKFQPISQVNAKIDLILSLCNLSSMSYDERFTLIKQMQQNAPKALFIEYENPERNLAYPMFYSLIAGKYLSFFKEKIGNALQKTLGNNQDLYTQNTNNKIKYFKEYFTNGALEGFIYDIPSQTGINPKMIARKNLYMGGIGLFYCEW